MSNRVEIERIEFDNISKPTLKITVVRQPIYTSHDEPRVSDIPDDMREALIEWLTTDKPA